jgi:hypothetical protein
MTRSLNGIILAIQLFLVGACENKAPQERAAAQTNQKSWVAPVMDDTRALGQLLPNGEQQAETVAWVEAGQPTDQSQPPCLGSTRSGAAAECATVCVRYPPGSRVSKIESLAADRQFPEWLPCGPTECMGMTTEKAKAMFEASGPTEERELSRVCWGFRNWHPEKGRHAILLITFRAPMTRRR